MTSHTIHAKGRQCLACADQDAQFRNRAFMRSHEHIVLTGNAFCRECGYEISRGKSAQINVNTNSITCYDCAEAITGAPTIHS